LTSEDVELVLLALMLPLDPFVGVDGALPTGFVAAAYAVLEVPPRSFANNGVVVPEILTRRCLRMARLGDCQEAGSKAGENGGRGDRAARAASVVLSYRIRPGAGQCCGSQIRKTVSSVHGFSCAIGIANWN
jgi:hypothetical protein